MGIGAWTGSEANARMREWTTSATFAATTRIGSLEVIALLDAAGSFGTSWERMFPDAADRDWEEARTLDPEAFGADRTWHLRFHCFAIRRPDGMLILVDVGVGPEGSPAAPWAPVPGRLPDAFREAGIAADDVDVVVLTHLHEDHVGWAVLPDGTPLFPNARYVAQRDEIRHLDQQPNRTIWDYVVAPLRRSGQLEPVDGEIRLADGSRGRDDRVTAVPTPGHTVGHQSVVVESRHRQLFVTGDVLVHAVQLANPDVAYHFETDQAQARATRRRVLARAQSDNALLATAHLSQPFVKVRPVPSG